MLDRWSQEIIAFLLSGAIAFGLPFGVLKYLEPRYSEFGMPAPVDWNSVIGSGLLMTLFGIAFYSLPLTAVRTAVGFQKRASTILVGAVFQIVGLAFFLTFAGTYNWFGTQELLLSLLILAFGVAASVLIHQAIRFKVSIEKN